MPAADYRIGSEPTPAQALLRFAAEFPDAPALRFSTGEGTWTQLSYRELVEAVTGVAVRLRGIREGRHGGRFVLVALPSGLGYVTSVYACLLAGVTAVPFYPPARSTRRAAEVFDGRLAEILRDCDPAAVIGTAEVLDRLPADPARLLIEGGEQAPAPGPATLDWALPAAAGPALLQYTSGSTARPKGVLVSHQNLMHNVSGIAAGLGSAPGESLTTWLPLFHDMGLIGTVLHPIAAGMTVHLLPPAAFLRRPASWLETVARTGSTITMAPDFAYALAARRAADPGPALAGLRHAVIAAEPIRPATIRAFRQAFEPFGLHPQALTPGYGLAENTLCVSSTGRQGAAEVRLPSGRLVIGCGREPIPGSRVAIVDPATGRRCTDGTEGEIWVSGPSVAGGYWRQPAETEAVFRARLAGDPADWLRTGDYGVLTGSALCITGRLKDVVMLNGATVHLHDLEQTAQSSHPALRPGGNAAFAVPGTERVVLLQELAEPVDDLELVMSRIRRAIAEEHGLALAAVALLPRGTVPHTTSGKVRRRACGEQWLAGDFIPIAQWINELWEVPV